MKHCRPLWVLFLGTLLACSAAANDASGPSRPDVAGGRPDVTGDAGGSSDAAADGSTIDGGSTSDGGSPDGGSTTDPGPADGGPPADLGTPDDGVDPGDVEDATAPPDATPDTDAGPPPSTATTARYVRIHTTVSPSWVAWAEVQVFGADLDSDIVSDLARGRPVTASDSTDTGPPEHGVDGDEETAWNANGFPPAWFEVDLGRTARIERIRLLVGQDPPARTVHELQLRTGDGAYETIHTFDQPTENGQWLEFVVIDGPDVPDDPVGPADPDGLGRGLRWVRDNPMFISGLVVSVGPPSPAHVHEYFDDFHANAVHTWARGLPGAIEGWRSAGRDDFRWVSWVTEDGTSHGGDGLVGGVPPNPPGRIGYQIGDEPGLDGDGMADLRQIETAAEAIRAHDPAALLIVNFSWWAEALTEMMDYYGTHMDCDVVSYDLYSLSRSAYKRLAYFRAAGLRHQLPYWRYIYSYEDVGEGVFPTETDMRWDALSGIVYGYTGHTWFVYQAQAPHAVVSAFYTGQGDLGVAHTARWAQAAEINRQMAHLGRAITQLTSTAVRYIPGVSLFGLEQPTGTRDWSPGDGGDPYITLIEPTGSLEDVLVGFFVDDVEEQYTILQNPNHAGGDIPTESTNPMTIRVEFDFGRAPSSLDPGTIQVLNHRNGRVETRPLTTLGGDRARLEVRVEAGDVFFFKYATDSPFALGPE